MPRTTCARPRSARGGRTPLPDVTGLDTASVERLLRRDPGYVTENVVPVTDAEQDAMASWIYAIDWATRDETWTA